jgi:hypothetical protein
MRAGSEMTVVPDHPPPWFGPGTRKAGPVPEQLGLSVERRVFFDSRRPRSDLSLPRMRTAILYYCVIGLPAGFMVVIALMEFARQRAKQFSAPKLAPVRLT